MFAIKPSLWISSLCYSVFRLEPYGFCEFSCIYCYARWYRRGAEPQPWVVKLFSRLAGELEGSPVKPYFRLATLSDPLQWSEEVNQLSLKLMSICLDRRVPLVLNTKGARLLTRSPWLDALVQLAEERLVLVQVSLSAPEGYDKLLEPGAPSTTERLEAIEVLREHRVPVVARIQPLIPGFEWEQLRLAAEAMEAGALGLIGESLRETREGLRMLYNTLNLELNPNLWAPYTTVSGGDLLHPNTEWRSVVHWRLASVAARFGAEYTPCKDGPYPWWRPGLDCCQALKFTVAQARRTLREQLLWSVASRSRYKYILPSDDAPRLIRRAIRMHEAKAVRDWRSPVKRRMLLEALGLPDTDSLGVHEPSSPSD